MSLGEVDRSLLKGHRLDEALDRIVKVASGDVAPSVNHGINLSDRSATTVFELVIDRHGDVGGRNVSLSQKPVATEVNPAASQIVESESNRLLLLHVRQIVFGHKLALNLRDIDKLLE